MLKRGLSRRSILKQRYYDATHEPATMCDPGLANIFANIFAIIVDRTGCSPPNAALAVNPLLVDCIRHIRTGAQVHRLLSAVQIRAEQLLGKGTFARVGWQDGARCASAQEGLLRAAGRGPQRH